MVHRPKWSEEIAFCFCQMIRSPRRLDAAQYVKNCQNWLQTACYVKFSSNFGKLMRYLKPAYQTASEKNAGSKTLKQEVKKGSPYYTWKNNFTNCPLTMKFPILLKKAHENVLVFASSSSTYILVTKLVKLIFLLHTWVF